MILVILAHIYTELLFQMMFATIPLWIYTHYNMQ